jgi:peptide/nickel transport system substrate-binding protein
VAPRALRRGAAQGVAVGPRGGVGITTSARVPSLPVILTACLALSACTKVGTTSDQTAAGGGRHPWTIAETLRIGVQTTPNSFNPILATNTTEASLDRLIFDPLVTVDQTGKKEIPVLAETVPTLDNGGISKDGRTLTYHLRQNVVWHDGAPFTSADVKFTWDAIDNGRNNVISTTGYSLVKSVDTPDAHTVVFHMKQAFSPAVNTIFGESDEPFAIMPAHLLASLPNLNKIPFNAHPIGTGPFILKEWARGDHIELVPNDKYFLGKPRLQHIIVKIVPDENTELNQLRAHELDWQFEASPDQYRQLKTLPDVRLILQDKNEIERFEMNTQHPPLDDPRVRRAIVYAIDREKLTATLTAGSATAADQDLPPFMWAHSDSVTRYPFDLGKATALMREAGWTPGPDGVLQKNGKRLTLEMVTNSSNVTRRAGLVQVQAMLHRLGIAAEIKLYSGALLFNTMQEGGILQSGKFDLAWTGWVAGIDPDQSSIWLCSAQPPHGNNESHYCNKAMDDAQETALTNFSIPARTAAYAKIEALLSRDVPQPPIWWPRQIQPINPDFKGFAPNPVTETWNAYQWDI